MTTPIGVLAVLACVGRSAAGVQHLGADVRGMPKVANGDGRAGRAPHTLRAANGPARCAAGQQRVGGCNRSMLYMCLGTGCETGF